MSIFKEGAATGTHQLDGPPRQNSSRCGNNHTAANALNQSLSYAAPETVKKSGERMNQEVTLRLTPAQAEHFTYKQKEILKNSICKGISDEEFEVFLMACIKTQLDPFMRQIYAMPRKSKGADGQWKTSMTIQTGIDGYRLIAERTERYAPGAEPTYVYDENGRLVSSTAYIKKQTADRTWHTVSASAYLEEYVQTFVDKQTGQKRPTGMWATMPRTMLAKCAEAQALRKAFPAEMSGIYTKEEMEQADTQPTILPIDVMENHPKIEQQSKLNISQISELKAMLDDCDGEYKNWFYSYVKRQYGTDDLSGITADKFDGAMAAVRSNLEDHYAKLCAEVQPQLLAAGAR